jgi:iron complex outermembrane recepter protein
MAAASGVRPRAWHSMAGGCCLGLLALSQAATAETPANVDAVVVTARLRPEDPQAVPAGLTLIDKGQLESTGAVNVGQFSQLVPSLYYNSPNPRNTAFTIRGLGSSVVAVSQANDGLEPGVGVYVDEVYHARPATASFDLADVNQVTVLRGPQGTVFGKNTTAGAILITTAAPTFRVEGLAEATVGDYGYRQGKLTLSGPLLGDVLAGRISVLATHRDGMLRNVTTGGRDNDLANTAVRAGLLYQLSPSLSVRLTADYTRNDSTCCTQVYVGVGTSLKATARQFPALAAGAGYAPASLAPYARLTDIDAPLAVDTNEGGLSAVSQLDLGAARVTSITAWRFWNWDAANDRDYTRLSIQTLQHIPSRQDQYSQELRIASKGRQALEYVAGLFYFNQGITGRPITQYGPMATYWLLGPAPTYPANLLDGYGTDGRTRFHSNSTAVFGEATWRLSPSFNITGGLRYTREAKVGSYATSVYGGAAPATPALASAKLSILRPQAYEASTADGDLSGRIVAAADITPHIMAYASHAQTGKSGGLNMSGLPLNAANQPALATAVIRPERNITHEFGIKTRWLEDRLTANADVYETTVRDFQTNVVDTGPGALRGYLANISRVRVRGAEFDGHFQASDRFVLRAAVSWTRGQYVSYVNGPCPLEQISASTTVCNLSGRPLSATPKWAWSVGAESHAPVQLGGLAGEVFTHAELSTRTRSYGDPTDSRYTLLRGYALLNATVGLRGAGGWEATVWVRNLTDQRYLQNVTVQAGNSGLIVGTPSDPRTLGITLRNRF